MNMRRPSGGAYCIKIILNTKDIHNENNIFDF